MSDCAVVSPEQGERTLGATATERDEALAVERIALDVAAADDDGTEARVRVPHSAETPAQCPDDDEGLEEDEGGNGTVHGARGGCCQTRAGAWCCSRRVLSSFAMFSVLAVIGLLTSSFGPALPIIVNQTNVSLATASYMFSGRSAGYFIGCILSGPLFDWVYRESIIIGISVVLSGVCHIAIPFVLRIAPIVVLAALQGFSIGALDAGGSVCFIRLHGDKVGPWMQAMHFSYAIGTAVAPFLVGAVIDASHDIVVSFVVIGAVTVIVGIIAFFVPSFKEGQKDTTVVSKESTEQQALVPPCWKWTLVTLVSVFLCIYATIEISFGSFLSAYSIALKVADEVKGSFMTSVFWCTFCLGRLVGVPVATRLRPAVQSGLAVILCLAVSIIFITWRTEAGLWTVAALYGFVMAPTWAATWSMLGAVVPVSGKVAVVIGIGASIGDLGVTLLSGNLIANVGPMAFTVQHVISCVIIVVFFVIILLCIRKIKSIVKNTLDTQPRPDPTTDAELEVLDVVDVKPGAHNVPIEEPIRV